MDECSSRTEFRKWLFLLPSADGVEAALKRVLTYTHEDHFPHLDGFITFAPHWHLAHTVQEMERWPCWVPPFEPVMEVAVIDSAMIMDFHLGIRSSIPIKSNKADHFINYCGVSCRLR